MYCSSTTRDNVDFDKLEFVRVVTMDFIFEAIFELIIEGGIAIGTNKKYSKWIRYPLLFLAGVTYVGLIALFVFIGFDVLGDGLWRAIVMWLFALAFVIATIWAFRKEYKRYKKKKSKLQ